MTTAIVGGSSKPRLVVPAASSMTEALERAAPSSPKRLSFAGSDELAAQIRQGVKPDVYAAANTKLPDALHDEGLLGKPVGFATNELVLAVPAGSRDRLRRRPDRQRREARDRRRVGPDRLLHARDARQAPGGEAQAILANVRSNEPDVKGIVGKLTQGAVDAGFVYVTDVNAAAATLKAIELPAGVSPR